MVYKTKEFLSPRDVLIFMREMRQYTQFCTVSSRIRTRSFNRTVFYWVISLAFDGFTATSGRRVHSLHGTET
jgi:hypothetical protein